MRRARLALETLASLAVASLAAFVLLQLITASGRTPVSQGAISQLRESLPYAIGLGLYLSVCYLILLNSSRYYAIALETTSAPCRGAIDLSTRFLSLVPTPFIVAILLPSSQFEGLSFIQQYLYIAIAMLVSAAPTALRIARDGFTGYSKDSLSAAQALGLSKWYALRKIVSLEHIPLFSVSAVIATSRILIENWLALQMIKIDSAPFLKLLSDPGVLATSLEQAYSSANEKMTIFYVLLLVAISFSGKLWSLVASQFVKP